MATQKQPTSSNNQSQQGINFKKDSNGSDASSSAGKTDSGTKKGCLWLTIASIICIALMFVLAILVER